MRLKDKVAIITGAAAGIGRTACEWFIREGAITIAVDRDGPELRKTADQLASSGARFHSYVADLSLQADCRRAAEWTLEQFNRLDVLVNNAGIVHAGSLLEASDEDWEESMNVNVRSMFWMCRCVLPAMIANRSGSIINMSSVASMWGVRKRGVYTVSKAAVVGLTKSLAIDFIESGIRVNAICPATVDTPSLRGRIAASPDPQSARAEFLARQPLGRLGTSEEIAALVVYLASDESGYMTGQTLLVDGGMKL